MGLEGDGHFVRPRRIAQPLQLPGGDFQGHVVAPGTGEQVAGAKVGGNGGCSAELGGQVIVIEGTTNTQGRDSEPVG